MASTPSPSADDVRGVSADPTATVRAEGTRVLGGRPGRIGPIVLGRPSEGVHQTVALTSGDMVIDLAAATLIDSSTVHALSNGPQMLDQVARRLRFRSLSRLVARDGTFLGRTISSNPVA
jgi:hypothetical protein